MISHKEMLGIVATEAVEENFQPKKQMRILIIGGAGFLGSHIKQAAEAAGACAVSFDVKPGASIVGESGNLNELTTQHFDRIIDVSGRLGTVELFQDIKGAVAGNIVNTLSVLQACEESGTHYTYVTLGNKWLNPYSITKNCAADFVRMYDQVLKLPTQVAVTYNCFGPGQKWQYVRRIVPDFMTRVIAGKPIEIFGDGRQTVDLVYVKDFAKSLVESVISGERGTRHYGTANPMCVKEVAALCCQAVWGGVAPESGTELKFIAPRSGETGGGDVCSTYPMKYQTDTLDALKETADWYKANYKPEP